MLFFCLSRVGCEFNVRTAATARRQYLVYRAHSGTRALQE